ncbi:MAG: cobalamin-dependent protein [Kofleriaceae bacterium]
MAGGPRTLRILVARPGAGVPAHEDDRGAKLLARALADGGYEVVYAGLDQTPEMIAATAVQEAVDAIGLAGAPTTTAAMSDALAARGIGDMVVKIFPPQASAGEIVDWVENDLRPRVSP